MVLFVSQAKGIGGSTRSLGNVLEGLEGRATRVLAAPRVGKFPDLVKQRGLIEEHVALPTPGGPQSWRSARLVAAVRVARWARRNRKSIAAIHANGPEEVNIAAPAALLARVPLVVWIHAFEVSPWTRRLGPVWRRLLRRHDVTWTAVSRTARRVLTESGMAATETVTIVPNPIDPSEVVPDARSPRERVTVAYIGSAEHRKGFQMLPEVMAALADLDVRWELYTNENSRDSKEQAPVWDKLRSLPEGIISFCGKVEDIRPAYGSCDIVFCPSLKESFCRVAAEAMLNGVPVVASDLEPLRELLGDDRAGLLFEPGASAGAIASLRTLVLDSDLRARLGAEGRARAVAFEPNVVTGRLALMYGLPEEATVGA